VEDFGAFLGGLLKSLSGIVKETYIFLPTETRYTAAATKANLLRTQS
jgi:hypothetical protein